MYLLSRLQKKPPNRPLGVGGDQLRGAERLAGLFHPDIERVLVRLDERDELTVGRNLRAGNFGVAEDQLAIDQRGKAGAGRLRGRLRLRRHRRQQRRDQHQGHEEHHVTTRTDGVHSVILD